ncbi:MAG: sulfate ABC transporter permease [Cyclobacteriaceae bacterium]
MQTAAESHSLYETDRRLGFLLLCLLTLLLLFVKKSFIENETAVFEFLQDRPEGSFLQILSTLQYLTIPLVYLWKFTVIAFVIWVGCFMFGYKVTYSNCWSIALMSEFIFIIPELLKILWFTVVQSDPEYLEVINFYPLAIINLFDFGDLQKRFIYPLKALNLFEILYWGLLISGVHYFARKSKKIATLIVACSYILLFLMWLVFYTIVYN